MTRQFENLMDEVNELIEDQSKTESAFKEFLETKKYKTL